MNSSTLSRSLPAGFFPQTVGRQCRQMFDGIVLRWQLLMRKSVLAPYRALIYGTLLALAIACPLTLGAVIAHLTTPRTGPYGPYVCLPASFEVLSAEKDENWPLPSSFASRDSSVSPAASGSAVVRGEFNGKATTAAQMHSPPRRVSKYGILAFSKGNVSIETFDGSIPIARLRQSASLALPAALDPIEFSPFTPLADSQQPIPPLLYGEILDDKGQPARWAWRDDDYPKKSIRSCEFAEASPIRSLRQLIYASTIAVPGAHYGTGKYRKYITQYAEQYNLATALMLAIMHTESNFNPFAVSPSQAVGLMQIVPSTAGNEVYRYLMGTQGTPSLETLFTPEHNIKYGAVYLHLLGRRYFGSVSNAASRQMCVIAAYNGGPNAVFRMFDSDQNSALARINSMTPEQVYAALTTGMPSAETRRYVETVMNRIRSYSSQ